MSPEDLVEIRSTLAFAATNGADEEFLDTAYNLLAHIDSQATQIEALKEEADCSDIVLALEDAGIMGDGEQDIITAIEILGSRIDAMKEKLVEERARRICHNPREDMVGHWPRYEDIVVKEARQQLKADPNLQMAGVVWDE